MLHLKYFTGILVAIISGVVIGWLILTLYDYVNNIFIDVQNNSPIQDKFSNETKLEQSPVILNTDQQKKSIKITFIGDLMFDRHIRKWADENSCHDIFNHVKNQFKKSDLVVGNLEGPITDFESLYKDGNIPNNYTFTFDPKISQVLQDANIQIVSLDNNHIFDYGREGLNQTIENLKSAGIEYFGNPDNREILYKDINEIRLAFLSYNQFIKPEVDNLLDDIRVADYESDYVIVFPHWGNEYEKNPTEKQILLAHKFIDNGADLVIGAHPHVIQKKEKYKSGHIYYSIGNFIFDQYFSDDVKCGAVVTFEVDKNRMIHIEENFISLDSKTIVNFSNCQDQVDFIK